MPEQLLLPPRRVTPHDRTRSSSPRDPAPDRAGHHDRAARRRERRTVSASTRPPAKTRRSACRLAGEARRRPNRIRPRTSATARVRGQSRGRGDRRADEPVRGGLPDRHQRDRRREILPARQARRSDPAHRRGAGVAGAAATTHAGGSPRCAVRHRPEVLHVRTAAKGLWENEKCELTWPDRPLARPSELLRLARRAVHPRAAELRGVAGGLEEVACSRRRELRLTLPLAGRVDARSASGWGSEFVATRIPPIIDPHPYPSRKGEGTPPSSRRRQRDSRTAPIAIVTAACVGSITGNAECVFQRLASAPFRAAHHDGVRAVLVLQGAADLDHARQGLSLA